MIDIDALNDQSLNALLDGMKAYPPNIPFQYQQAVRDAVAAWQSGNRSPEVTLALSFATAQAVANVLRSKVYQAAQDTANRMAM